MPPKLYLKSRRFTYKEFCKVAGIPYTTFINYINARRRPTLENVQKIEEASNGHVTAKDWQKYWEECNGK